MHSFVRNIEVNSLINIGQRVLYACQVVVIVLKYPLSVVSFQMVKGAEHQVAHFLYLGSGRDMPSGTVPLRYFAIKSSLR